MSTRGESTGCGSYHRGRLHSSSGLALLWCVKGIERKSSPVYFLAATFFAGGLARLISMLTVGPPSPFFVAMTGLELAIPPAMALAQRSVSKPVLTARK